MPAVNEMEKAEEQGEEQEVSVRALCEELWQFRLRHRPGFAIFKGLIPAAPALDSYATESFRERKVSTSHWLHQALGSPSFSSSYPQDP
jgi:hypothetical protein